MDGATEAVLEVIEIRGFDLSAFSLQFDVPIESDPHMLDRYGVGPDDIEFLRLRVQLPLTLDFTHRAYFIEAVTLDTETRH
jgi:hypothetical protein